MVFRLVVTLFLISFGMFSQENFTKHTISKGENITIIAKKYGVKPKAIMQANPKNSKILKLNSVLLIPTSKQTVVAQSNETVSPTKTASTHQVLAKETLWGISKKYNVTVEDLKKANPELETEGLKLGQKINIPSNDVAVAAKPADYADDLKIKIQPEAEVEVSREVLPKETKYKIAKEFGITVAELERQNPSVKAKLPVGYLLKIKTSKEKADALNAANPEELIKETLSAPAEIAQNSEIKIDSTTTYQFTNSSELIDQLVGIATDNIGIRYRTGGTSKSGFDCSGLMCSTFGNFDIKLPRTSIEQSRVGQKVEREQAQKGDLIFFKTNGRRQINHVGMVVEVLENEIKFVHASTHGGVMISSTKEGYYQKNFSQVNRVLQ
jgi:peptidoglycan endopeptidase LytE